MDNVERLRSCSYTVEHRSSSSRLRKWAILPSINAWRRKKKIFSFLFETTNKSRVCAMEIIQQHRQQRCFYSYRRHRATDQEFFRGCCSNFSHTPITTYIWHQFAFKVDSQSFQQTLLRLSFFFSLGYWHNNGPLLYRLSNCWRGRSRKAIHVCSQKLRQSM